MPKNNKLDKMYSYLKLYVVIIIWQCALQTVEQRRAAQFAVFQRFNIIYAWWSAMELDARNAIENNSRNLYLGMAKIVVLLSEIKMTQ